MGSRLRCRINAADSCSACSSSGAGRAPDGWTSRWSRGAGGAHHDCPCPDHAADRGEGPGLAILTLRPAQWSSARPYGLALRLRRSTQDVNVRAPARMSWMRRWRCTCCRTSDPAWTRRSSCSGTRCGRSSWASRCPARCRRSCPAARCSGSLGDHRPATLARSSFFGVISSSCSYASSALAKSLFARGADFTAAIVFMIASHQPRRGARHRAVAADRLAVRAGRVRRRRHHDRAARAGRPRASSRRAGSSRPGRASRLQSPPADHEHHGTSTHDHEHEHHEPAGTAAAGGCAAGAAGPTPPATPSAT